MWISLALSNKSLEKNKTDNFALSLHTPLGPKHSTEDVHF